MLEEVFLGLDSLKGLELGDKGLVALAIALSAIAAMMAGAAIMAGLAGLGALALRRRQR